MNLTKRISFSFIVSVIPFLSFSQKNNTELFLLAKDFCSKIELYSGKKGIEDRNLYGLILKYKDGDDAVFHANDLFGERERSDNFSNWMTYLSSIADDFNNDISVTFDHLELLNCNETRYGFNCAIFKVKKTLKFKENTKTETEYIFINLNNYKIAEVVFPDFYENKGGSCRSTSMNIKEKQVETKNEADIFFSQRNYVKAKELYLILKVLYTDNSVISQIQECDKYLSLPGYLKQADEYFNTTKYDAAKSLYTKILTDFALADKTLLENKIDQCTRQINENIYNRNIEYGDHYFNKGIYSQARYFYSLALQIKPADISAQKKMDAATKEDPELAFTEINKAIAMAEKSKKNYGTTFRIMMEFEQSGLLTTENYYFLSIMTFSRNSQVKKEMNFSNRDFDNYLNIFIKKLKEKTETETDPAMKEKAIFLFEEVINQRYQK